MVIPLRQENVATIDSKTMATQLIKRALTEPLRLFNPFKPEGVTQITVSMTDFNFPQRRTNEANVFYTIVYKAKPGVDYYISAEENLTEKIAQRTRELLRDKSFETFVHKKKLNQLRATMEIKTITIETTAAPSTSIKSVTDKSSTKELLLTTHLLLLMCI